jgi:hypothetical protein
VKRRKKTLTKPEIIAALEGRLVAFPGASGAYQLVKHAVLTPAGPALQSLNCHTLALMLEHYSRETPQGAPDD